jgi:chromate reductase
VTTNILAISGSLRANSSNTAILEAAIKLAPPGCEMRLFSGLDLIPHFNPDRESEPSPGLDHFRSEIKKSDALLICSPEYAHGIPGTLKNALDSIVSSGELDGLPIGIINATPMYEGTSYAQENLIEVLKTMSANIKKENTLSIYKVRTKLDSKSNISDSETIEALSKLISSLLESIELTN